MTRLERAISKSLTSRINRFSYTQIQGFIVPLNTEDWLPRLPQSEAFVGTVGFEPTTSTVREWQATRLPHAPIIPISFGNIRQSLPANVCLIAHFQAYLR